MQRREKKDIRNLPFGKGRSVYAGKLNGVVVNNAGPGVRLCGFWILAPLLSDSWASHTLSASGVLNHKWGW